MSQSKFSNPFPLKVTSSAISIEQDIKMINIMRMEFKDTISYSSFWFSDEQWFLEVRCNCFGARYLGLKRKSSKNDLSIFSSVMFKFQDSVLKEKPMVLKFDEETDFEVMTKLPLNDLSEILQNKLMLYVLKVECSLSVPAPLEANSQGTYETSTLPYFDLIYMPKRFETAFLNKELADILLVVGLTEFPAHKIILAAQSSVLKEKILKSTNSTLHIEGCEPDEFRCVLWYMYTGKVYIVTADNAIIIFKIANKYKLKKLQIECCIRMAKSLTIDNICSVLELSDKHEEKELLEHATEFFIENSEDILRTEKWKTFRLIKDSVAKYCFEKLANAYHHLKLKNE